ncbi:MAG: fused MFS/spermidine synthase [Planctomycetota bacterium]
MTLSGAGTMVVELSAVRLLAPWFGSSNGVWTHAIGVILMALALGYAAGGRLSSRGRPEAHAARVLFAASLWCAALPFLAGQVAPWFRPADASLHGAGGLLFWGSLVCAALLFLVPALLLGCVAPLAVQGLSRAHGESAGQAGGHILALSTLGSLVGTFATTYWCLPVLGLRWTFLLAGGLLALAATLLLVASRSPWTALVLLPAAAGWLPGAQPAVGDGQRLIAEVQSPYQWIRVLESGAGETLERRLVVNEALDSFQSLWRPEPGFIGLGSYYDYFVPPAFWDRGGDRWRVLILGLGAGTAVRVLEGTLPAGVALESTGVELDAEVVRLGREYFELQANVGDRRVYSGQDARAVLAALPRDFDQILVDAYANNVEIPPHLCTREFFAEVREHLRPGGWVTANVSGFGLGDPVVNAMAQTLATGMQGETLALVLPFSRNVMLYARREAPLPRPDGPDFLVGPDELRARLECVRLDGCWRVWQGGEVAPLTDDRSPMQRLQDASIAYGVAGWMQAREAGQ